MIRLRNGVIYAQLSKPDMRHPIHDALYWPEITCRNGPEILSFDSLTLEFEKPDAGKFPMLNLAWDAAMRGGLFPCAYNAANEEAAAAFLNEKIGFLDIPRITDHVLSGNCARGADDLKSILEADAEARRKAGEYIKQINKKALYADN